MPRTLKPQKVDEVFIPETGDRIDIMFDRNPGQLDFFALYGGESVMSKDASQMPDLICALVARLNVPIIWNRVIEVELQSPSESHHSVSLIFRRFEWGYRKNGDLIRRDWIYTPPPGWRNEPKEEPRYTGTPNHWGNYRLPKNQQFATPLYLDSRAYLAYTDELWAGLEAAQKAIYQVAKRIESLVGTPEGNAQMALVGAQFELLLPAQVKPEAATE